MWRRKEGRAAITAEEELRGGGRFGCVSRQRKEREGGGREKKGFRTPHSDSPSFTTAGNKNVAYISHAKGSRARRDSRQRREEWGYLSIARQSAHCDGGGQTEAASGGGHGGNPSLLLLFFLLPIPPSFSLFSL